MVGPLRANRIMRSLAGILVAASSQLALRKALPALTGSQTARPMSISGREELCGWNCLEGSSRSDSVRFSILSGGVAAIAIVNMRRDHMCPFQA